MASQAFVQRSVSSFSDQLYGQVIATQAGTPENVFFSPVSIFLALCMTLLGAKDQTKTELLNVLNIRDSWTDTKVHTVYGSALNTELAGSTSVQISIANKLFQLQGSEISQRYRRESQRYYSASLESLIDYESLDAQRQRINQWVSENTQSKITELLPPGALTAQSYLSIVNAIFFKGSWTYPFNPSSTRDGTFHLLDGSTIPMKMMYSNMKVPYAELDDLDAEAIKLPFGDTTWEMVVILPYTADGLPDVLNKLQSYGGFSSVLDKDFDDRSRDVFMPRFKLSHSGSSLNLKNVLTSMGAPTLFSQEANLQGISPSSQLFVSDVFHKAILEVTEEGATAAASTSVNVFSRSASIEFKVDHPFIVAIVHRKMPVFLGHVVQPEYL